MDCINKTWSQTFTGKQLKFFAWAGYIGMLSGLINTPVGIIIGEAINIDPLPLIDAKNLLYSSAGGLIASAGLWYPIFFYTRLIENLSSKYAENSLNQARGLYLPSKFQMLVWYILGNICGSMFYSVLVGFNHKTAEFVNILLCHIMGLATTSLIMSMPAIGYYAYSKYRNRVLEPFISASIQEHVFGAAPLPTETTYSSPSSRVNLTYVLPLPSDDLIEGLEQNNNSTETVRQSSLSRISSAHSSDALEYSSQPSPPHNSLDSLNSW
jgi:hypothetical protein